MKCCVVPCSLRKANDFVEAYHRHSLRTARDGGKWAIAAATGSRVVGVAIVGNPLSATLMDGFTAEVLRTCVLPDAPRNCNSLLYGACRRIWFEMGGALILTYTLTEESGASLRGAGWTMAAEIKGHNSKNGQAFCPLVSLKEIYSPRPQHEPFESSFSTQGILANSSFRPLAQQGRRSRDSGGASMMQWYRCSLKTRSVADRRWVYFQVEAEPARVRRLARYWAGLFLQRQVFELEHTGPPAEMHECTLPAEPVRPKFYWDASQLIKQPAANFPEVRA